jgi:hypothetical protein
VLKNYRGQIFDSGPGRLNVASYITAMTEIVGGFSDYYIVKYAVAVAAVLYVLLVRLIRRFAGLVSSGGDNASSTDCYDYIFKDKTMAAAPYLFLYSSTDDIICSGDVDDLADYKSKSGCDVTKVCYEDSKHVAHFIAHRESYITAVNSFVIRSIKDASAENLAAAPEENSAAAAVSKKDSVDTKED